MMYRILNSPPGYPDDRKYMVVAYENLDLDSRVSGEVTDTFAATLDEARRLIPKDSRRLEFEPSNQFLELYSQNE